jgi:hypothetical protein
VRRLVVVGGGYIGLEQACIFNNLGSEVHLVVRQVWAPARAPTSAAHILCSAPALQPGCVKLCAAKACLFLSLNIQSVKRAKNGVTYYLMR